jgi:hypothetical protein
MSQYQTVYTPEDSAVVFIDHQPQVYFIEPSPVIRIAEQTDSLHPMGNLSR